jgi:hypothetical protein
MRVAVTGASGQLGQALLRLWPDAIPVGHTMPPVPVDLLVHAACPDWRDPWAVDDFGRFNLAVRQYANDHSPKVVNVGSWWQYAGGDARGLAYTQMKDYQMGLFPDATHVIAYSIYGPVKGFIRDLIGTITGTATDPMTTVGSQWRDFVHVDDVAAAIAVAANYAGGTWLAATGEPVRTDAVAEAFGLHLPRVEAYPAADLHYPRGLSTITAGRCRLYDYIADALATHARESWTAQRTTWKAA